MRMSVFSFLPGFTNSNEKENGGSSASDILPGGSGDMDQGVSHKHNDMYDPLPNDDDPGDGWGVEVYDRMYLYGINGLSPLVEYISPKAGEFNQVLARYVYGIPGATVRIETDKDGDRDTFWLHPDGNASVRSVTDHFAVEVADYRYDAFGNVIDSSGSDTLCSQRFLGKNWEREHGFTYMVARFYDPRFGRFTSPDPDHTVMSPYTYVLNNPVSLVDPTGHTAQCGGAYSMNFKNHGWHMVIYGAYLWRTWAGLHRTPPEVRTVQDIWGYGNLTFTDASGASWGSIFDQYFKKHTSWIKEPWYMPSFTERLNDKAILRRADRAKRRLQRRINRAITYDIPSGGPFMFRKGQGDFILTSSLTPDLQEIVDAWFNDIAEIAYSTPFVGHPDLGEMTIADVINSALSHAPHLLICTHVYEVYERDEFGTRWEDPERMGFNLRPSQIAYKELEGYSIISVNEFFLQPPSEFVQVMMILFGEVSMEGLLLHTIAHEIIHQSGPSLYLDESPYNPENYLH